MVQVPWMTSRSLPVSPISPSQYVLGVLVAECSYSTSPTVLRPQLGEEHGVRPSNTARMGSPAALSCGYGGSKVTVVGRGGALSHHIARPAIAIAAAAAEPIAALDSLIQSLSPSPAVRGLVGACGCRGRASVG